MTRGTWSGPIPAVHATTALVVVVLLGPATGTMSAAPDATADLSFVGTWTLDPYVSDHPEQVARALRFDTGTGEQRLAGASGRNGEVARGAFGGNAAGDTARRDDARGERRPPLNATDQRLLSELTDSVRFAPTRLTITQADMTVSISTSATSTPDTLHADGKAEKRQLKSGTVECTARWDGPRHLVVAYAVGQSSRLTYFYEVAPTTGQLVVRITFEPRAGELAPFEVKFVYDRLAGGVDERPRARG